MVITLGKKFLKENNLKHGDHVRLDKITKVKIKVVNDEKDTQKRL